MTTEKRRPATLRELRACAWSDHTSTAVDTLRYGSQWCIHKHTRAQALALAKERRAS